MSRSALSADEQRHVLDRLNAAEAFERFLHTRYVGQKRFGLEGARVDDRAARRDPRRRGHARATTRPCSAWRTAVGSTCWPTSSGKSYWDIFSEFEGNLDPESVQGSRRREVPQGRRGRLQRKLSGSDDRRLDGVEPLAPRGGEPGRRGHGPRQAGPVVAPTEGTPTAIASSGRSVPRSSRCSSTATPPSPARASSPRPSTSRRSPATATGGSDPRRDQQPGRLHHGAGLGPLELLPDRRGQDGPGADLPRERRRPRGVRASRAPGLRLPRALPQGRRHRPGLLPPPRPQRGRRPELHPAADVPAHRREALGAQALHRDPGAPGRHHASTRPSRPSTTSTPSCRRPRRGPRAGRRPTLDAPCPCAEVPEDLPAPETGIAACATSSGWPRCTVTVPEGFTLHPKLDRQFAQRAALLEAGQVDWALAEALAFGSLLEEGTSVRMTGQDSRRGTFSHRHAALVDYATGDECVPLRNVDASGASFTVRDSLLSEYAASASSTATRSRRPRSLVDLGGPVRRLRQRRRDHHRQLPRGRRGQVGPGGRPGHAPAARLRGAGARALERPSRALPVPVRPQQPPRDACRRRRRSTSTCSAAQAPQGPPDAAHRHDAEVAAARGGDALERRRARVRLLPDGPR